MWGYEEPVYFLQSRRPSDYRYTNKQVAEITGLGENTVKEIDKKRLQNNYTTDNGSKLIKPQKQAKYLGIDEFKLHNGHRYATHIIDLETGHILWIQNGKKKQVIYDFIDHVGLEWMDGVEAVACDMNSDFQEAFEEKCHWIQPVFDYFHIVKNFNDKVVRTNSAAFTKRAISKPLRLLKRPDISLCLIVPHFKRKTRMPHLKESSIRGVFSSRQRI